MNPEIRQRGDGLWNIWAWKPKVVDFAAAEPPQGWPLWEHINRNGHAIDPVPAWIVSNYHWVTVGVFGSQAKAKRWLAKREKRNG